MSREIVTIVRCDLHQARDEEAPGRQYDVAVRTEGDGFKFLTVDLCEACAKSLLDLVAELSEVGREFDGEVPEVKTGKPRGRKPIPDTIENRTCPECGFVSASRKAMTTHLRQRHQRSAGGPFECDVCGEGFASAQGRGAHRRMAHKAA